MQRYNLVPGISLGVYDNAVAPGMSVQFAALLQSVLVPFAIEQLILDSSHSNYLLSHLAKWCFLDINNGHKEKVASQ